MTRYIRQVPLVLIEGICSQAGRAIKCGRVREADRAFDPVMVTLEAQCRWKSVYVRTTIPAGWLPWNRPPRPIRKNRIMPKFKRGDRVRKTRGSSWQGHVCGEYSTELTPEGYAVESEREPGSVQIYPAGALEHAPACARCRDTGWLEAIEGVDGSYVTSRPCGCEAGYQASRLMR